MVPYSLPDLVGFFFHHTVFYWVVTSQKLFHRLLPALVTCSVVTSDEKQAKNALSKSEEDASMLRREDLEMVMQRMGIYSGKEDGQFKEYTSIHEINAMFEDNEPSLQEVREAFSAFDQNDDGFIDALELKSFLSKMGLDKGLCLDACQEIIMAYDENEDRRIDFSEFVKLMETAFAENF